MSDNSLEVDDLARLMLLKTQLGQLRSSSQAYRQDRSSIEEERDQSESIDLHAQALELALACSIVYEELPMKTLKSALAPIERLYKKISSQKVLASRFVRPIRHYATGRSDLVELPGAFSHGIVESVCINAHGNLLFLEETDRTGSFQGTWGRLWTLDLTMQDSQVPLKWTPAKRSGWYRSELVFFNVDPTLAAHHARSPGPVLQKIERDTQDLAAAIGSPGRKNSLIKTRAVTPDMFPVQAWRDITNNLGTVLKQTQDKMALDVSDHQKELAIPLPLRP